MVSFSAMRREPGDDEKEVEAIHKLTPKPIRYVIIASDHGDHTAGITNFRQT